MLHARRKLASRERPSLRVIRDTESSGHIRYWRINGYMLAIQCWTDAEFHQIANPPSDAIHYPEGIWIRLDWR
ncbi:MAG: hypothetical protein DWH73_02720 [Planctomycetota bacterium]|nr:MAG: hypothetical protein DWH73_02720 [Planctomycetota bacterium]